MPETNTDQILSEPAYTLSASSINTNYYRIERKLAALGDGWSVDHYQFFQRQSLYSSQDHKWYCDLLTVLLTKLREDGLLTIETLDRRIRPILIVTHGSDMENLLDTTLTVIEMEETQGASKAAYDYIAVNVDYFDSQSIEALQAYLPFDAQFERARLETIQLLKPENPKFPNFNEQAPYDQLLYLAETIANHGYFLSIARVDESLLKETFNYLLNKWFVGTPDESLTAGSIFCYMLAADSSMHSFFLENIESSLLEVSNKNIESLALLLGAIGLFMDTKEPQFQADEEQATGGGIALVDSSVKFYERVCGMIGNAMASRSIKQQATAITLLSLLAMIDPNYSEATSQFALSKFESDDGISDLQDIAEQGPGQIEALTFAMVPAMALELFIGGMGDREESPQLLKLIKTILHGTVGGFDPILSQCMHSFFEMTDPQANILFELILTGFEKAIEKGEETAISYLDSALDVCTINIEQHMDVDWPEDTIGVIRHSGLLNKLILKSDTILSSEDLQARLDRMKEVFDHIFERVRTELLGTKNGRLTDQDIEAAIPQELATLNSLVKLSRSA